VLQEIQSAGVSVLSSSEYRPPFDEVFAALVTKADQTEDETEEERESSRRLVSRAA
jgi:hypothetical protein